MKSYLVLNITFHTIIGFNFGFSQCPKPGLKIGSAICNPPITISISDVNCSTLRIKWQGNQNQTYIIKATGVDLSMGKLYETETSKYSCDFAGNCNATIPVKEGTEVNWSVQGVCKEGTATLYSYKQDGEPVSIPFCNESLSVASKSLHVSPNPTTGNLTVSYSGKVTHSTTFTVFDNAGKAVFYKTGDALISTNTGYKLNLRGLASGAYLLKVSNGKEASLAKFVLSGN